jgi:hypothetical protein
MAEAELDLKLQQSLIKSSENLQISMERYNSILDKVVGKFKDIDTYEKDINVKIEKTGKTLKDKIFSTIKDIGKGLLDIAKQPLAKLFSVGYLVELVKRTLDHQKAIRDLSYRMGEAGKTAGQLSGAMFKVAGNLGLSTDQSLELIEGLRRLRVSTADMTEMATATGQFARITGVTNQEAISLTGNLIRMGGLGTKATTSVLTSMAQMQRVVGLTEADMGMLTENITEATRMLGQMGKGAGQIENFNKGVIKLAGGFAKVGISVEKVTDLVDKLLDPGAIEDNAILYAKLGVSIQDVVSGNVDIAQLNDKMRDFGKQMKDMSGPAASALAKQMGMTLKDARALADLPIDDGMAKAGKNMAVMYDEQRSVQEKMMAIWNSIATRIEGLMTKILPVIEKLLGGNTWKIVLGLLVVGIIGLTLLFRRKMLGVATEFGQTVGTATTEALVMAQHKATAVAAGRAGMRGRGSGLASRVEAGPGYANVKGTQSIFQAMSQSDLFPKIAKMTANTAEWLELVARGQRPISLLGALTGQMNQKLRDRMDFTREEALMMKTATQIEYDRRNAIFTANEARIKTLSTMKRTAEQEWGLRRLTDQNIGQEKIIQKLKFDIGTIDEREEDRLKRTVNRMLPEAKAFYADEVSKKKQSLDAANASLRVNIKDLEIQRDILVREEQMLKLEREGLAGATGAKEIDRYNQIVKRMKEIRNESGGVNQELGETGQRLKTDEKAAERLAREMQIIGEVGAPSGARATSFFNRVGNFFKSSIHTAVQGADDLLVRGKNSFGALVKGLAAKLNPANILGGARGAARDKAQNEGTSTMGKLAGTLGKVAGIAFLVWGILSRLKPIQDIIAKVTGFLGNILKAIMPALQPIIDALLPLIMTLVKVLLPPIMKLLGGLLYILGVLISGIFGLIKTIGKFLGVDENSGFMKVMNQFLATGQALKDAGEAMFTTDWNDKLSKIDANTAETADNTSESRAGLAVATGTGSAKIVYGPNMGPASTTPPNQAEATTAKGVQSLSTTSSTQLVVLTEMSNTLKDLKALMQGKPALYSIKGGSLQDLQTEMNGQGRPKG